MGKGIDDEVGRAVISCLNDLTGVTSLSLDPAYGEVRNHLKSYSHASALQHLKITSGNDTLAFSLQCALSLFPLISSVMVRW